MYTGFIYLWYDRKKNYFCVGSHMGTIDDGYTSSTGIFQKEYKKRPHDFKRRIIYFHAHDKKSLLEKEQYYLDQIKPEELFSSKNQKSGTCRYYNIKPFASGISGEYASELRKKYFASDAGQKWKQVLSEKFKTDNPCKKGNIPWNKGIIGWMEHTEESKNKIRQKLIGRNFSENHRKKISEAKSGVAISDDHKEKIRLASIGRKQTDYQKQQASKANSKTWIIITPDGVEETVHNLRQYCITRNMDPGNLMKTLKNPTWKYKGYKALKRIDN